MNAVTLNGQRLSEVMAAPETETHAAANEPALPTRRTPLFETEGGKRFREGVTNVV